MISSSFAAVAAASASEGAASAATVTAAEVGMIAATTGFIMGWAVVFIAVLFLLGILAEHNRSSGWSVFFLVVAAAIAFMAYSVPLSYIAIGSIAYFVIGFIWSFYRYKRHVQKKVAEYKDSKSHEKERVLASIHPKAMLWAITAWVINWPVSLIGNMTGDLITVLQTIITKMFRGVYYRIYDAAVSALK